MRKISVILDDITSRSLDKLVNLNQVTISDIVNTAIVALAQELQPIMPPQIGTYVRVKRALEENGDTVDDWCFKRDIDKLKLKYVCRRIDNGHAIWGFGNEHHKWRDKADGRIYKTKTAWVAQCLQDDFGITSAC